MSQNYYECLGIDGNASAAEIKKAYRRLCKQFHPDANPGDKVAEEKFKEINEAHKHLGDKKKRSDYDAKINADTSQASASAANIIVPMAPGNPVPDFGGFFRAAAGIGAVILVASALGKQSPRKRPRRRR